MKCRSKQGAGSKSEMVPQCSCSSCKLFAGRGNPEAVKQTCWITRNISLSIVYYNWMMISGAF